MHREEHAGNPFDYKHEVFRLSLFSPFFPPTKQRVVEEEKFYIMFTHQQMHFLLNLEKFKFT